MARVWRALDRHDSSQVALKVLHDNAEPHRLEREARALEALNHPSIARHVAHGWVDDRPYLVLQWLDGRTLAAQQAADALDVTASLKVLLALCDALATAHEAGVVHRDVKLSNIIVARKDPTRCWLIDFGIARLERRDERPTTVGRAIGTPGFMAPEQAHGDRVDGRSDLFALGCVAYTLLAGEPPFRGPDSMAVLAASLTTPTPRLDAHRQDLAPDLVELVAELMQKQAAARPRDASHVAERLAVILASCGPHFLPAPEPREASGHPPTSTRNPVPCFGRDRELSRLKALSDETASERRCMALVISGSAGVGKTRLLEQLVAELGESQHGFSSWLGVAPAAAASPLELVVSAARSGVAVERDEQPQRGVERVLANTLNPSEVNRVAPFVLGLLTGEAPAEAPLLQAAQLDPRLMAEQVQHALRRWFEADALADLPLCFILTTRNIATGPPLRRLFEQGAEHLRLGELAAGSARRLAEFLAPELGPSAIDDLVRRSGGLPLYVEQLALHGAEATEGTLGEVVRSRLSQLSRTQHQIISLAAVLGREFSVAEVTCLADAPAAVVSDALGALVRVGLLRGISAASSDRRFAFRHEVVRDAAYGELASGERQAAHATAARVQAVGPADPARVARHFDLAGLGSDAAGWHVKAAMTALSRADLAQAESHLDAAGAQPTLVGGDVQRIRCMLHNLKGEAEAAAAAGELALTQLAGDDEGWVSCAAELAVARGRLGDTRALRRVATAVSSKIDSRRLSGDDLEGIGLATMTAWERIAEELAYAAEHELASRLLDACERASRAREVSVAWAARLHDARSTQAYLRGDDVTCQREIAAALRSYERLGDMHRSCEREVFLGWSQLELGRLTEAEGSLRRAVERAAGRGLVVFELSALQNLGLLMALRGRLAEAIRLEQQALTRTAIQEHLRLHVGCREILARIHIMAGDAVSAEEQAQRALAELTNGAPQRAPCLALLAQSLLAQGDVEHAAACAAKAVESLRRVGGIESTEQLWVWLARADVCRASGDDAAAREAQRTARDLVLARAARISDDELRDQFLQNAPECERALEHED